MVSDPNRAFYKLGDVMNLQKVAPEEMMKFVKLDSGNTRSRFVRGDNIFTYGRRPIVQQGTDAEYAALPES